jgi:hypothetical protein
MPDDLEQARTLVMIHIDDARAAIESAGRRISDPAARADLERQCELCRRSKRFA